MVRDMKQIISSMEKKFRQSPEYDSGIVNHSTLTNTTTNKRIDSYLQTAPLGLAIERLQEIFRQGLNRDMLFIRYEDLCSNPILVMESIYNYFELPYYTHNFKVIEQLTQEDDSVYGVFGDHVIKPSLKLADNDPQKLLGPDICQWIDNTFKWYNNIFGYQI